MDSAYSISSKSQNTTRSKYQVETQGYHNPNESIIGAKIECLALWYAPNSELKEIVCWPESPHQFYVVVDVKTPENGNHRGVNPGSVLKVTIDDLKENYGPLAEELKIIF